MAARLVAEAHSPRFPPGDPLPVRAIQVPEAGFAAMVRPDAKVWDGRFTNLAWAQERGDPLTKVTWEHVATLAHLIQDFSCLRRWWLLTGLCTGYGYLCEGFIAWYSGQSGEGMLSSICATPDKRELRSGVQGDHTVTYP